MAVAEGIGFYGRADEYTRSRIILLHRKLGKYQQGVTCRSKWLRRRKFKGRDKIYESLLSKAIRCRRILSKISGD